MPENTVYEAAKFGWVSLIGVMVWLGKALHKKVDENAEQINEHILEDLRMHQSFVTQTDFTEFKEGLYSRWDKLDAKQDMILAKVSVGIDRKEFKEELKDIYKLIGSNEKEVNAKIDDINRRVHND